MSARNARSFLRTSTIVAVAAAGLVLAGAAQAQPYDDGYAGYPQAPPAYPQAPTPYADGLTVTAPAYREGPDGTRSEVVAASRVVNISDLDLDTGWGVHVMHERIKRAATAVCRQLDDQWAQGLYPVQPNDADCYQRAVAQAMANAPVGVDAAYNGY